MSAKGAMCDTAAVAVSGFGTSTATLLQRVAVGHRDALADALMGCLDVGGVSGESLTRSTCPDPWHEDEDAYENTETAPTPVGGGPWVETRYECPTCGFSTLSSSVMVTPDDPAYRYVKAAIERV